MGFEPTISCVTGRRALQAAPRGQSFVASSSGGIRTHSIPGSKPRWSASCLPSRMCPEEESNLESRGFKPSRSASWRTWAFVVVPDGVEPSFPVCKTGVVAVGPRDCQWTHWESHPDLKRAELVSSCWTMSPLRRKPWDSNPKSLSRPTVFKTASSSGRMTSVLSCGSWNRTDIKTFRASRPTVRRSRKCIFFLLPPCAHMPSGHVCSVASSGGRNRTYGLLIQSQASLPTATTPEKYVHLKSALRELNPPRQLGRLAPLPLGQGHESEGVRVELTRLIARLFSRQLPSPIGLPFRYELR
jgi:hypothetical protein